MRLYALLLGLLLLPASADAQARTYELVGGEVLFETLHGHERGQLLAVRKVGERDTLLLWTQGVTQKSGPSREAARVADIVAWCYPGQYPDPRHVLPAARRVGITVQERRGKTWVSVVAATTIERIEGGS
jgi:hypothetical protein